MQKADSPPKWAESFDNVADSVFHRPPKLIKPVTYEKLTSQYLSARLPNETERLENMSAAWKEFENLTLKHLRFPTFSVRLLGTHFPLLLDPLFLSRTNFGAAEATPLFLLTKAVSNGALPAQGDVANLVAETINRTGRRCRVCACCPGVSHLSLEGHAGPFDIILLLHIECGEELMSTYIESRAKINPSVVGPADNSGSSGEATPLAKDDQIDKQVLETLGICPLPRTYFEALHQHRSETTSDSSIGVVGYQAATITPSVVDNAKIGGPSEKTAQVATDNGQANGLQSPRNSFVLKGLSVLRDAAAIQDLECDPNMQKRQQLRLQKLFRVAKRWVVHRHIHGLCYGYAGWKELAQLCKDIVMSSTKRTPLILLLQSFFQRALLSKSVRYCAHWKLESQRAATSMAYLIDLAKTLASRSNRLRHSCTLRTCRDVVIENLNQRRQSLFAEANIFKTMTCMVLIRGHHNRQMTVLRHLSALLNELESFSPWNEIIISEKHLYFVLWSSTPVEDERNLNENLQRWCFDVNKSECISSKLHFEIATKATDVPTWVRDYFGGINLLRLVEGHFATPKYQPRRVLDKQFASQLATDIFEKTKVRCPCVVLLSVGYCTRHEDL